MTDSAAMRLHCCNIDCDADAEFEIVTVRRGGSGYDGPAGPDPYSDYTQSCEAHVGSLLGYQPDALEPEHIYWHVRSLSEVEIARGVADGSTA